MFKFISKNLIIVISLSIFLSGFAFPTLADTQKVSSENFNLTSQQQTDYSLLQSKAKNLYTHWSQSQSVPDWARSSDIQLDWTSQVPSEKAKQFFAVFGNLYKMQNPDQELQLENSKVDEFGMTHVTFQQIYQSVPVYGGEQQVDFNVSGTVAAVHGHYLPNINQLDSKPNISADQAIIVVKNNLQHQGEDLQLQTISKKLYIYNPGLLSGTVSPSYLTWAINVYSPKKSSSWLYYVDAHNGTVIHFLDTDLHADSRATYVMADCTDTTGTLTYDQTGIALSTVDDQAETVNTYMGYVYSYYDNVIGRDSYDGHGKTLVADTHYETTDSSTGTCQQSAQASWQPDTELLQVGQDYLSLDLIGHEITHGVIQYTTGLGSEGEPGALNESYADIFGEMVEQYAVDQGWHTLDPANYWILGNEIPAVPSYSPYTGSWGPSRDMSDPHASPKYWQPAHVNEMFSTAAPSETNDYGYVHYNEGITNNAFYLTVHGGTNPYSGQVVAGSVDKELAAKIYFLGLAQYIQSDSNFSDSYNATLQACIEAHDVDSATYPISYCETIFEAFQAVGINTETTYPRVDLVPSTETGYAPLTVDLDGSDSFILGSASTAYKWDFDDSVDSDGNGSTTDDVDSTDAVTSYTYSSVTSTHARLTITDDSSNSTWDSVPITVSNPITASFSQTGDGTAAPDAVSFDASASEIHTGTVSSYAWNFGDSHASSSASSTVSHTYTANGNYNVTLTVTNDVGYIDTTSHMVLVGSTGPTTITGAIYNDEWTTARSPYIIYGGASVASGYTLTIDPGVVVKFLNTSASLTVNGTLDAEGTSTSSIVFTSIKDDTNGGDTNGDGGATTPAAGNWQQINFASGSVGTLNYDVIRYGGQSRTYPMYPMVTIQSDNIIINNSSITDSVYNVVSIESSSPAISNSIISDAGSMYSGINISDGSPTLEGNTVSSNDYGVYMYSGNSVLNSNTITNNTDYSVVILSGSPTLTANIISNSTSYSTGYGVYIVDGSPTLDSNSVSDNPHVGVVILNGSSTLERNTISGSEYGLMVASGSSIVDGNTISDNSEYGIYTNGTAISSLYNNSIYGNTTYGLYNSSTTTTLTAESNWWGETSGPYNLATNPSGTGNAVSDYVDFTPWAIRDPLSTDFTSPAEATITIIHKDPWNKTLTLVWTNPTDTDFSHVRITRTDSSGTTTLSDAVTATNYADTTVSYGTSYTYTLYTLDTTGNVSTGITTAAQVVRNPFPTNLILTPGSTTIAATWNASSAPAATIGTYKVYYGTAPTAMINVLDVGNVTSTTISGLTNGTQYFVSVIAYSKGGIASPRSAIKAARPHP